MNLDSFNGSCGSCRFQADSTKKFQHLLGRWFAVGILWMLWAVYCAYGALPDDLTELSLEELADIQVYSVAKRPGTLADAAAAVFVLTQEDLRRAGVTTIADALRVVPGVQVAKVDANKWAISVRGFNDRFSNKLLVLMDGRSVYTPLFAGVYWDVQDTLLADIDRIEVIRGPGASLWGANAVNGVINIITKNARDTQGTLVKALTGNEEHGTVALRHGGKVGENMYYRAYGKVFDRDEGKDGADDWRAIRTGFRLDGAFDEQDSFTLQGDIYRGESGVRASPGVEFPPFFLSFSDDTQVSGGNLLLRWNRRFENGSDFSLQTYYDRTNRDEFTLDYKRDTFDLDFQYRYPWSARHDLLWGLGFRYVNDDTSDELIWSFEPAARDYPLYSAFIQDEIELFPKRFWVTVGSKFEHNDFTGFEVQPSARFLWTPGLSHSLWGAVSRAVRTPSRAGHDGLLLRNVIPQLGSDVILTFKGSQEMVSEELIAYELGYRFYPMPRLNLDLVIFYNDYDELRTLEPAGLVPGSADLPPHRELLLLFDNKMSGETYGLELATQWQPTDWWKLSLAYSYLQMQLHLDPDSEDGAEEGDEEDSPHHQVALRSWMNLGKNWELNAILRYVDETRRVIVEGPAVGEESYLTLDLNGVWRPSRNLELSLVGQNLFGDQQEFRASTVEIQATEVEPSVFFKVVWWP